MDDFDDAEAEFFDEQREKDFFGDDDYTLLSKVPEDEEEEQEQMSLTQKDLKVRLAQKKVEGISRDIATVQSKIQMYKEAGEQETGQEGIFQKLIDKYEVLQQ